MSRATRAAHLASSRTRWGPSDRHTALSANCARAPPDSRQTAAGPQGFGHSCRNSSSSSGDKSPAVTLLALPVPRVHELVEGVIVEPPDVQLAIGGTTCELVIDAVGRDTRGAQEVPKTALLSQERER